MTLLEAIDVRHSVRAYKPEPITDEIRQKLDACVDNCNKEGNLNISIQYDDQQKFMFGMKNGEPAVKVKGIGPYTKNA